MRENQKSTTSITAHATDERVDHSTDRWTDGLTNAGLAPFDEFRAFQYHLCTKNPSFSHFLLKRYEPTGGRTDRRTHL